MFPGRSAQWLRVVRVWGSVTVAALLLAPTASAASRDRDRDRDRLPDRWERQHKLPTDRASGKGDVDRDRLSNRREYLERTNPRRRDTDRDRLSDRAELNRYKTDPRRRDTDRDGVNDGAEIRRGTDPLTPDSRDDGGTSDDPGADDGGDGPGSADGVVDPGNDQGSDDPGDGAADSGDDQGGSNPEDDHGGDAPEACTAFGANVAGGPDPWNGCWPSATTTGVPDGTALTGYTGPCTITAPATVIDAKQVDCGYLNIRARGVIIRNSHINGAVLIDDPHAGYSLTITDSTVNAGPVDAAHNDGKSAIGKSNFTATRVETYGGIRGVWCEYDCVLRDSWIHGQDKDEGGRAHQSAVRMGDGSVIRHNTLVCDASDVAPDAGCSANLTGYGDFAPIRNNTIERNLFLATPGGTCAYGGSSGSNGSKPYGSQAANIVFRENVFQRRSPLQSSGKCGYWFAIADFDDNRPGNQWVNNTWDNGDPVPSW